MKLVLFRLNAISSIVLWLGQISLHHVLRVNLLDPFTLMSFSKGQVSCQHVKLISQHQSIRASERASERERERERARERERNSKVSYKGKTWTDRVNGRKQKERMKKDKRKSEREYNKASGKSKTWTDRQIDRQTVGWIEGLRDAKRNQSKFLGPIYLSLLK